MRGSKMESASPFVQTRIFPTRRDPSRKSVPFSANFYVPQISCAINCTTTINIGFKPLVTLFCSQPSFPPFLPRILTLQFLIVIVQRRSLPRYQPSPMTNVTDVRLRHCGNYCGSVCIYIPHARCPDLYQFLLPIYRERPLLLFRCHVYCCIQGNGTFRVSENFHPSNLISRDQTARGFGQSPPRVLPRVLPNIKRVYLPIRSIHKTRSRR